MVFWTSMPSSRHDGCSNQPVNQIVKDYQTYCLFYSYSKRKQGIMMTRYISLQNRSGRRVQRPVISTCLRKICMYERTFTLKRAIRNFGSQGYIISSTLTQVVACTEQSLCLGIVITCFHCMLYTDLLKIFFSITCIYNHTSACKEFRQIFNFNFIVFESGCHFHLTKY
jgi:hypothetical protein